LIPVFYSVLAPLSPPRAHAGVRLDRELRDGAEKDEEAELVSLRSVKTAAE